MHETGLACLAMIFILSSVLILSENYLKSKATKKRQAINERLKIATSIDMHIEDNISSRSRYLILATKKIEVEKDNEIKLSNLMKTSKRNVINFILKAKVQLARIKSYGRHRLKTFKYMLRCYIYRIKTCNEGDNENENLQYN